MIKEVIVVEGKDDIRAIKAAVNAEVIAVGGFGINEIIIKNLENINKRKGIIIFTDPDFAGDKIRRMIAERIPDAKHAFINREEARYKKNIGVENATSESILNSLKRAKAISEEEREEFNKYDLFELGLISGAKSKILREKVCEILGIGYSNGNQFLSKLNNFGITIDEFKEALNMARREIDNGR